MIVLAIFAMFVFMSVVAVIVFMSVVTVIVFMVTVIVSFVLVVPCSADTVTFLLCIEVVFILVASVIGELFAIASSMIMVEFRNLCSTTDSIGWQLKFWQLTSV